MTNLSETAKMRKYRHLVLVEFLEMVCRVAVAVSQEQDMIEYKVERLLEQMFKYKFATKEWDPSEIELRGVSE